MFNNNGVMTYVAFNPEPYASNVTFNLPGGTTYTLDLPAKSEVAQTVGTDGTVTEHDRQRHPRPRHRHVPNNFFLGSTPDRHDVGHADAGPDRRRRAVADDPRRHGHRREADRPAPRRPLEGAQLHGERPERHRSIPTQLPQFSIWLDPGYITTNVTTQAPVIRAELTIDPDGTGQHDVSEIFDGTVNLALGKPGYVEYNSSEVQVLGGRPPCPRP